MCGGNAGNKRRRQGTYLGRRHASQRVAVELAYARGECVAQRAVECADARAGEPSTAAVDTLELRCCEHGTERRARQRSDTGLGQVSKALWLHVHHARRVHVLPRGCCLWTTGWRRWRRRKRRWHMRTWRWNGSRPRGGCRRMFWRWSNTMFRCGSSTMMRRWRNSMMRSGSNTVMRRWRAGVRRRGRRGWRSAWLGRGHATVMRCGGAGRERRGHVRTLPQERREIRSDPVDGEVRIIAAARQKVQFACVIHFFQSEQIVFVK
mmetsp:Transcript_21517/g.36721  ORF Transcript_21517/g.36721 Transcript_21517/m.36721 type:complete len:264 (+) Transcript_21517:1078-1869(+)